MQHDDPSTNEPALITNRPMEVAVSLVLLGLSGIVIYDSWRIGVGWLESQGPAGGYFPFYVALVLGGASLFNLIHAVLRPGENGAEPFVSAPAFRRVLSVLIPSIAYVALIGGISVGPVKIPGLGIYAASALFIAGFMIVIGRESILRSAAVGIGVPVALFFMFERWFLVPLPKGPLEALFGY